MIYKNIRKTDYQNIVRFMNVYGFPINENLMKLFHSVNGGKPVGFHFKYEKNGKYVEDSVYKLLSFDTDENENIYDAAEMLLDGVTNPVPFAIDENENYICYLNGFPENIWLYDMENSELYRIYTENEEIYDAETFFGDMET